MKRRGVDAFAEELMAVSAEVDLEELRSRPFSERLRAGAARLLTPYL